MAESRNKIKAIGAPFVLQHSSCSDLVPKTFHWSDEGDTVVHIDRGMFLLTDSRIPKQRTFGWVCESRFIVPDVYHFLIEKHKLLFETFYNKIFTCDHDLINLNSNFIYCPVGSNYPWIKKENWKIYDKTKICSMFCSPKKMTEGHIYRHKIARLALDTGFDVFGGVHGTPRTVIDLRNPWNTKIDGVKDYMFSVVVENGVYDSYWTEKLTDCFAVGTVPVYWGTKKLPKEFNEAGIIRLEEGNEDIILDSLSLNLYNSMKQGIVDNFNRLNNLKIADDAVYEEIQKCIS